ncbi:MAG: hypothetical protein JOY99_03275 [Sphingomonadaceae bacterium]|nr:hypothetical protein [Sphingomonadaceae bacterium]
MRFDSRELVAIFVGGAAIAGLVVSSPVVAGAKHARPAPKQVHVAFQKSAIELALR